MASSNAGIHQPNPYHAYTPFHDNTYYDGVNNLRPSELETAVARPYPYKSSYEYRAYAVPDHAFNVPVGDIASDHRVTDSNAVEEDRRPLTGTYVHNDLHLSDHQRRLKATRQLLRCWLPELLASILSVALLISLIIVLRIFEGRPVTNLRLPPYLTLNGIIAAIATVNRACLIAPTCSALMQEMWISYLNEGKKTKCRSRLGDMDLFSEASMGAWGCVQLLISKRKPM